MASNHSCKLRQPKRRTATNFLCLPPQMLFFFQASKKIPFDDPNVLNSVRALYVISNVLIAATYFYMQMKIDKKKGNLRSLLLIIAIWNLVIFSLCSFKATNHDNTQTSRRSNTSSPHQWAPKTTPSSSPPPTTPTTQPPSAAPSKPKWSAWP